MNGLNRVHMLIVKMLVIESWCFLHEWLEQYYVSLWNHSKRIMQGSTLRKNFITFTSPEIFLLALILMINFFK